MIGKVLIIVLLLGMVSGIFIFATVQGYVSNDLLQKLPLSKVPAFSQIAQVPQQLPSVALPQNVSSQAQTLVERGSEVAGHTQNVLGTQITASEDNKPLSERAFEYGRYLYCQQVVREYEQPKE